MSEVKAKADERIMPLFRCQINESYRSLFCRNPALSQNRRFLFENKAALSVLFRFR